MTSSLAIVGAGVRGTAALGRLAARLRDQGTPHLDIHVIDPHPPGSGAIWRTDQPRSLVMNTVAAHSTVFDDETLNFNASFHGPTFAEWCAGLKSGEYEDELPWVKPMAQSIVPWATPSRALYGRYLQWAFKRFAKALPDSVTLRVHRDRANSVTRLRDRYEITLASGIILQVDAALFALGWLPREQLVGPNIPAASPIDQGLESIGAGERIAVRGMGMGFIDLLSIVTEERGGGFSPNPTPSRPQALHYAPSGCEPRIFVGSRSGLPFLAKPEFGSVPPAAKFEALDARLDSLLKRRPLEFDRDVLPLIEHAAAWQHYQTLAQQQPRAFSERSSDLFDAFEHSVTEGSADVGSWRAVAAAVVTEPSLRFDAERIGAPIQANTGAALDAAIYARLEADANEASLGYASAIKRGLHVYQAARVAIVSLTDFGGITPHTRPQLNRYLSLANLAGSGPPLFRVEQLLALHRAKIVTFVGPGLQVRSQGAQTFVSSSLAQHDEFAVDRVVDAHLDLPDANRLNDPLLNSLIHSGLVKFWADEPSRPTIEISKIDSTLIDSDGNAVAGLHSVGPLHEELRRFTIIAPIPQARSTVLKEIDSAVNAMLTRVAILSPSVMKNSAAHTQETQ